MNKPSDPRELAVDLLPRSVCKVQVAAVIADNHGILGWGWNSSGPSGLGMHAEHHALTRVSKERAKGASIYVAARWRDRGKTAPAMPCLDCFRRIGAARLGKVWYRDSDGAWKKLA